MVDFIVAEGPPLGATSRGIEFVENRKPLQLPCSWPPAIPFCPSAHANDDQVRRSAWAVPHIKRPPPWGQLASACVGILMMEPSSIATASHPQGGSCYRTINTKEELPDRGPSISDSYGSPSGTNDLPYSAYIDRPCGYRLSESRAGHSSLGPLRSRHRRIGSTMEALARRRFPRAAAVAPITKDRRRHLLHFIRYRIWRNDGEMQRGGFSMIRIMERHMREARVLAQRSKLLPESTSGT
jgi:hypothetical protein